MTPNRSTHRGPGRFRGLCHVVLRCSSRARSAQALSRAGARERCFLIHSSVLVIFFGSANALSHAREAADRLLIEAPVLSDAHGDERCPGSVTGADVAPVSFGDGVR